MESNNKYGILLGNDTKIYRKYFAEMVKLLGIKAQYRSAKPNKHWTTYAEIESNYNPAVEEGVIFNEHPDQRTMKRLGWVVELDTSSSLISVRYDIDNLQVGALFSIPSGLDNGKNRLFRVTAISNIMIYPASITCVIVPEYEDTYNTGLNDYSKSDFNLLNWEKDNL